MSHLVNGYGVLNCTGPYLTQRDFIKVKNWIHLKVKVLHSCGCAWAISIDKGIIIISTREYTLGTRVILNDDRYQLQ